MYSDPPVVEKSNGKKTPETIIIINYNYHDLWSQSSKTPLLSGRKKDGSGRSTNIFRTGYLKLGSSSYGLRLKTRFPKTYES